MAVNRFGVIYLIVLRVDSSGTSTFLCLACQGSKMAVQFENESRINKID